MFKNLLGIDARRKRALKSATHPVMQEYLSTPFPDTRTQWQDCPLMALDLETTGLNPKKDQIISVGMVDIINGGISLSTANHQILRISKQVPESSAVIHQITDDVASSGQSIKDVIPEILGRLAGKVMLVHFNRIEQQFIDTACQTLYGSPFIVPTIDTMQLGERILLLSNHTIMPTDLRLFNLRKRYSLPQYKAHNALSDAIATAELFLALAAESDPDGTGTLKEFLN